MDSKEIRKTKKKFNVEITVWQIAKNGIGMRR